MIDYEVGSVDFWVSFGGKDSKPFPVTVYRKQSQWLHDAHPPKDLTEKQQQEVAAFVKERIGDMKHIWNGNMKTRLRWELPSRDA